MRHTLLLVILAWTGSTAPAQSPAFTPRRLEFTARLGGEEIGTETVEIRENGWTARGKFDVLGTRQATYEVVFRRTDRGFSATETRTDVAKNKAFRVDFTAPQLLVEMVASKKNRTTVAKGPGKDATFFYEDLLWASWIETGRLLARLAADGELTKGLPLSALFGSRCYEIPCQHVRSRVEPQRVGDRTIPLRISTVKIGGQVEFVTASTLAGTPLRIEIPAQRITVVAKGCEEVRCVSRAPTSIVDSGPWRQKLSKDDQKFSIQKKVMATMRDGVKLACDIYLPAGKGPFPTVLSRTPYFRRSSGALYGSYLASRGYVVVTQDVRGRGDSEGKWFPFIHESADGSDTLDWIVKQPWSDGRVGMIGGSYVGIVQWLAAKTRNPHLKCIVPQVSPPDPHENFPYEGGAFLLGAAWWARVLDAMDRGTDWAKGIDWEKYYRTLPLGDLDQGLGLDDSSFLDTWLAHPPHDRKFWEPASYQDHLAKIDIPTFNISGWFDGDQPGAIQNFIGMRRDRTKSSWAHQYLVLGPWTHDFNSARKVGEWDFGEEGMIDLDARILRFFDRYLKGIENGIEAEPKVFHFVMHSNRWHGGETWPPATTRPTDVYLGSRGNTHKLDGDGFLTLAAPDGKDPQARAKATFRYDPMDCPEIHADLTDLSGSALSMDLAKEPDRRDDLEFTSPPLAADCELAGPIEAHLHVSTDAKDTDFVVLVGRYGTDGKLTRILSGIQRLRYHRDPRKDAPVPPGTVVRITVDCWATGILLRKGERLYVHVSSWAWPGYARNLNTLEPQATAEKAVVARNTVHLSPARPSRISLPVTTGPGRPGLRFSR